MLTNTQPVGAGTESKNHVQSAIADDTTKERREPRKKDENPERVAGRALNGELIAGAPRRQAEENDLLTYIELNPYYYRIEWMKYSVVEQTTNSNSLL